MIEKLKGKYMADNTFHSRKDKGIEKHGHDFYDSVQRYSEKNYTRTHKMIREAKEQNEELLDLHHKTEEYMEALKGILHDLDEIEQLSEDLEKTQNQLENVDKQVEEMTSDEDPDRFVENKKKELKKHLIEDLEEIKADLKDLEQKVEDAETMMDRIENELEEEAKTENKWLKIERHLDEKTREIGGHIDEVEEMIEEHS